MKNSNKGIMLAIIAAVLWAYMGVPVKVLDSAGLNTYEISFLRSLIAGMFYLLICIKSDYKMLRVNFREMTFYALYALCAFFLTFIAYNIAIVNTSIAIATVLLFTSPVWVILFSYILFKEKITKRKILCMCITLFGGFLVAKGYDINADVSISGALWGIVSGISFALQVVLAKLSIKKGYSQDVLLAYSLNFTWIFLIPFVSFSNMKVVFSTGDVGNVLLNILIIGFLNTAIANGFYVKCVEFIEPSVASIIVSIEPVIASIVGYIVFKEMLDVPQIIGMVFVIASAVILNVNLKSNKSNANMQEVEMDEM